MAIDQRYIASKVLEEYLVDKDSGLPLANGYIRFFRDNSRTDLKPVYKLTGSPPNYSFEALPDPLPLSAIGTPDDGLGNNVTIYYLPQISLDDNTPDLYFVQVFSEDNVLQFTREGWPPNAGNGGTPGTVSGDFNYIPNGQFLIHNDTHPDNILGSGNTNIAQGGWVFKLPDPVLSTNLLTFTPLPWTQNPAESPPYEVRIQCIAPNPGDTIKNIGVQFNDVNKFSNDQVFTFSFSARATVETDVNIAIYKDFGAGGSTFTPVVLTTFTIGTSQKIFSVVLTDGFGSNAGFTVGTGQTSVSLDIQLSTSQAIDVSLTDFSLLLGNIVINDYPIQTNADTMARSVFGWTNIPDYTGQDMYLPAVLTPYGMTFDHSIIGKVEGSVGLVTSPTSISPFPIGNEMPCDGTAYKFADYSSIGIPFSRLGNYLIDKSPIANTPMYGTGPDFVTAYAYAGNTTDLRITVNNSGTGIPAASNGVSNPVPNTWTFTLIPTYDGSTTGSTAFDTLALNNVANTILFIQSGTPSFSPSTTFGGTGFTLTGLNFETGLLAMQNSNSWTLLCVSAAALANPSSTGRWWSFASNSTNYYMWFKITNETDPAPSGGQPIQVNLDPLATAQDVANIVRETLSAYQSTSIIVDGLPNPGANWYFSSNPGAVINYYVWYTVDNAGTDPLPAGKIGIKVPLLSTDTDAEIVTKTLIAINAYQYLVPNFSGMFPRGIDFDAIFDLDVAQRWSMVSGLSGANVGTFEYQQLLSHYHSKPIVHNSNDVVVGWAIENEYTGGSDNTNLTGGSETRPVNFYLQWIIRY